MAKGPRKGSYPEPCTNVECGYLTRPSKQPPGNFDVPTKPRKIGGLCSRCHQRNLASQRRGQPTKVLIPGPAPAPAPTPEPQIEYVYLGEPDPHTVAGLHNYLRRRRARQTRHQRTASEHNAV